jgi:hypothetical protein
MPKNCIEHGGKTYCWNQETKEIEEIVHKPIEIQKCPTDALRKLMSLLGENEKDN